MPDSNQEFTDFLQQEANRYFKALPGERPSSTTTQANSGSFRNARSEEQGGEARRDSAAKALPGDAPLEPNADQQNLSALASVPDSASESTGRSNLPTDYSKASHLNAQLNLASQATAATSDHYIKSAGAGLLYDPTRLKLPFQEKYEQPIMDLASRLKSGSSYSHGAQFPAEEHPSAYYFIAERQRNVTDNCHLGTAGFPNVQTASKLDVDAVRADFPILDERVNGHQLIWLDNAATTQKPQVVIDRIAHFYAHENSNIHRAAHVLAARATDAYEDARETVKLFLGAASVNEIIFTRGTTEAINLVASSWGEENMGSQDEIILSHLEHHANIVPWQLLQRRKGFNIRVIPVDDAGNLLLDEYAKLLSPKTKLVAFTHVSNALGTVTPAKQIIDLAHQAGAKVLLDGAQSVSHMPIDLQYLNPDFFVFSGHKIFGPTGIGVLYGREALLNQMAPYQGGGNMIKDVRFDQTSFHDTPGRFEAGTGNIADAVGLAAALRYVEGIGLHRIAAYEHQLLEYATKLLTQIPGIRRIGTAHEKASVLSFTIPGLPNDAVGAALNEVGIAVRTGHHCAQPILRRLGYESTVRPSLAFYNTYSEIDVLMQRLEKIIWQHKRYG